MSPYPFFMLIAFVYVVTGIASSVMALRLLLAAAHDRGVVAATHPDLAYTIVANKMVRVAFHRLAVSSFGLLAGVVFLVQPQTHDPRPISIGGVVILVGFVFVLLENGAVSYWDLVDRDRLTEARENV